MASLLRGPIDLRTPGVRQPEQARDLVERLAGGVVHRLAEHFDVGREVADEQQRRVPAADEQRDRGVLEGRGVGVQDVGRDVSDEVVDGVQRPLERDGERLRRADAHHECSGETGTARHGDRVDLGQRDACLGERGLDRRLQRFEVRSGGDLGHDPAVAGVLVHAARDGVAQQRATADDPDAGLVAARLDPEHQWPLSRRHSVPEPAPPVPEPVEGRHVHAPASWGSDTRCAAHPVSSRRITTASTSSGW